MATSILPDGGGFPTSHHWFWGEDATQLPCTRLVVPAGDPQEAEKETSGESVIFQQDPQCPQRDIRNPGGGLHLAPGHAQPWATHTGHGDEEPQFLSRSP